MILDGIFFNHTDNPMSTNQSYLPQFCAKFLHTCPFWEWGCCWKKSDVWLFTTQCYWPHKRWCIMYHHSHTYHTSSALFSSLNHPVAPAVLLEKCIIGTAHAGRAPVIVFTMDKKKTKSSGTAIFLMQVVRFVHSAKMI